MAEKIETVKEGYEALHDIELESAFVNLTLLLHTLELLAQYAENEAAAIIKHNGYCGILPDATESISYLCSEARTKLDHVISLTAKSLDRERSEQRAS